ncbi:MAG: nickel pincer cofactor biosynthesis protein LarB [Candidatus Lernaella stagnicola]|nr:nickel pincer cofactor biosynthesis protein LarB [Candidatus Lernaella stagnicola]
MSAFNQWIREILEGLAAGNIDVAEALGKLKDLPYEDLGFAKLDHHRAMRAGFPEVVLAEGKTPSQVGEILAHLADKGGNVLVTRANAHHAEAMIEVAPEILYDPVSRCARLVQQVVTPRGHGPVLVASAGTADASVAEEAAQSAELMGNRVERMYDVGVAGIHRLFGNIEVIRRAAVLIVVAGMEGALPSVVGGLTNRPVIAVPTSVGYGASFNGLAALLGMLNSCASGTLVVNIDNGFGAAYAATRIAQLGVTDDE